MPSLPVNAPNSLVVASITTQNMLMPRLRQGTPGLVEYDGLEFPEKLRQAFPAITFDGEENAHHAEAATGVAKRGGVGLRSGGLAVFLVRAGSGRSVAFQGRSIGAWLKIHGLCVLFVLLYYFL